MMKKMLNTLIIKANDDIIKELDNYFAKEYEGFKTTTNSNYKIYVYNSENNFKLANDLASCLED